MQIIIKRVSYDRFLSSQMLLICHCKGTGGVCTDAGASVVVVAGASVGVGEAQFVQLVQRLRRGCSTLMLDNAWSDLDAHALYI